MALMRFFRPLERDRPWFGLTLGGGLLAAVGLFRYLLGDVGIGFEPITLLPTILLTGLFGGIQVGLAVFAISVVVAWVWFFQPYGTFILTPHDAVTLLVFTLTAALELSVIRLLNLAINDLTLAGKRTNGLFRELQHRVANNMQFAAALVRAEKKTLSDDAAAVNALDEVESRLALMSHVHRLLHDSRAVDAPIERHLEDIGKAVIKASASPHIQLRVGAAPIKLNLESLMSLSLIVAELVTNCLKHAFKGRMDGTIAISIERGEGACILTVSDNGCGIAAAPADRNADGLGQSILRSLASQLRGTISLESTGEGTTAKLVFGSDD